jgi:hypothetical protein
MSTANDILRDQQALESERTNYETVWSEIARLVLPRHDLFNQGAQETSKPKPIDTSLYDSTGMLALERFGAAVVWMLAPPGKRWHTLTGPRTPVAAADGPRAKRWLESVRDLLFAHRDRGGFNAAFHETSIALGAFGTGCLYVEAMAGQLRYESVPLSEIFASQSAWGIVDKVHRRYQLTLRQAVQEFGDALPQKLKDKAEKEPHTKAWFLHCVKPRIENRGAKGSRGMAYASYHVAMDDKTIVRESGYRRMPYQIGRMMLAPGEVYGRSPAWEALPEMRMVNKISKSALVAKNRAGEPTYLAAEINHGSAVRITPNAINYGWVDPATGRPLLMPLPNGADIGAIDQELALRRSTINDAFGIRLWQILVETPTMTATEVLERAREKAALMAPTMGRLQSELLQPMIWRELDLLDQLGVLEDEVGPMPEELGAGPWGIEYESTLARDMKADDAIAITRTLDQLTAIAQVEPSVLRAFHWRLAAQELAKANGMPAKLLMTEEEMEADQAQEQQAMQAQQLAAALPAVTDAARAASEMGVM